MNSSMSPEHIPGVRSRRDILRQAGAGFGALALEWMLARDGNAATRVNPLASKPQHFAAKAKSVIFLFMVRGPGSIDMYDPKPALGKFDGQPLPPSYGTVSSQFPKGDTPLMKSPFRFKKYRQCGIPVSTLAPHTAECVDDICFLR